MVDEALAVDDNDALIYDCYIVTDINSTSDFDDRVIQRNTNFWVKGSVSPADNTVKVNVTIIPANLQQMATMNGTSFTAGPFTVPNQMMCRVNLVRNKIATATANLRLTIS